MNKKIALAVLVVSCTVCGGGGGDNPLSGLLSKTAPKKDSDQKKESIDLGKMAREGLDKFHTGVSEGLQTTNALVREGMLIDGFANHILTWSKSLVDQNKVDALFTDIKTALLAQGRGSPAQKKAASDKLLNAFARAEQVLAYADGSIANDGVEQAKRLNAFKADFAAIMEAGTNADERIQLYDKVLAKVNYVREQALIQARVAQANAQIEAAKIAAGQGSTGINVEWQDSGFKINFGVGTLLWQVKDAFRKRFNYSDKIMPNGMMKINVNHAEQKDPNYALKAGDFVRVWPLLGTELVSDLVNAATKFLKDSERAVQAAVQQAGKTINSCGEVMTISAQLAGQDIANVGISALSQTATVVSEGLKGVANIADIFTIKGGSFHGKLSDVTQSGVAFAVDMMVLGKSVKQNISLNPADFADQVAKLIKDNL
jgi:hypothetical protein